MQDAAKQKLSSVVTEVPPSYGTLSTFPAARKRTQFVQEVEVVPPFYTRIWNYIKRKFSESPILRWYLFLYFLFLIPNFTLFYLNGHKYYEYSSYDKDDFWQTVTCAVTYTLEIHTHMAIGDMLPKHNISRWLMNLQMALTFMIIGALFVHEVKERVNYVAERVELAATECNEEEDEEDATEEGEDEDEESATPRGQRTRPTNRTRTDSQKRERQESTPQVNPLPLPNDSIRSVSISMPEEEEEKEGSGSAEEGEEWDTTTASEYSNEYNIPVYGLGQLTVNKKIMRLYAISYLFFAAVNGYIMYSNMAMYDFDAAPKQKDWFTLLTLVLTFTWEVHNLISPGDIVPNSKLTRWVMNVQIITALYCFFKPAYEDIQEETDYVVSEYGGSSMGTSTNRKVVSRSATGPELNIDSIPGEVYVPIPPPPKPPTIERAQLSPTERLVPTKGNLSGGMGLAGGTLTRPTVKSALKTKEKMITSYLKHMDAPPTK